MRVAILATLVSLAPATWAAAGPPARERRTADDMREIREAFATLAGIIEAASRPTTRTDDAPRLLRESLRTGTVDPAAMGAIMRWVIYEKEEKVAAVFAGALASVDPGLKGVEAERWSAAARSVVRVFEGVLRDAQDNRRQDGESLLRELRPAIDAAAEALKQVQETQDPVAPRPVAPEQPVQPNQPDLQDK